VVLSFYETNKSGAEVQTLVPVLVATKFFNTKLQALLRPMSEQQMTYTLPFLVGVVDYEKKFISKLTF
jgi:hypothetical protein